MLSGGLRNSCGRDRPTRCWPTPVCYCSPFCRRVGGTVRVRDTVSDGVGHGPRFRGPAALASGLTRQRHGPESSGRRARASGAGRRGTSPPSAGRTPVPGPSRSRTATVGALAAQSPTSKTLGTVGRLLCPVTPAHPWVPPSVSWGPQTCGSGSPRSLVGEGPRVPPGPRRT